MAKFKVGDIVTFISNNNTLSPELLGKYEVIQVGQRSYFCKNLHHLNETLIQFSSEHLFKIVKPLRSASRFVNIYEVGDKALELGGIFHKSLSSAKKWSKDLKGYIDTIEVSYTEKE